MNARVALFTGAVTTAVFVLVGIAVFTEGHTLVGSVLIGLGVLRGTLWLRSLFAAMRPEDDQPG